MINFVPYGLPIDRPFTAAQAEQAGVHRNVLTRLVTNRVLVRPFRGVYLAADCPDSLAVRAACLKSVLADDAFAADHTAAWLHGGDPAQLPNADLRPLEPSMIRAGRRRAVRRDGCVSGERDILQSDLMEVEGVLVTTPLRTALDIGRLHTRDAAMWGLDSMMAAGGFGIDELLAQVERFRGHRGVVQLRELAPLTDAGAESFGESALRLRWYAAGLPRPQTQIRLMDGDMEAARLDIGLTEELFAAEFDGAEWHADQRHDEFRRGWVRDRFGYDVEAFRGEQVFGADQEATLQLRRARILALAELHTKRTYILGARRGA